VFVVAGAASVVGDEVRPFVLVFAAYGASHSALMVGVVLAAGVLPQVIFLPLGGSWATLTAGSAR
jgi:hypothetical protein